MGWKSFAKPIVLVASSFFKPATNFLHFLLSPIGTWLSIRFCGVPPNGHRITKCPLQRNPFSSCRFFPFLPLCSLSLPLAEILPCLPFPLFFPQRSTRNWAPIFVGERDDDATALESRYAKSFFTSLQSSKRTFASFPPSRKEI